MIFFDLETTGVSITKDRIVQISAIKTDLNLDIIEKKKMLINPTIPIPESASSIHGILDEHVKDAHTFSKIAKGMAKWMVDPIVVGYNSVNFDIPLLMEEFNRESIVWPSPETKFIDCYKIFASQEKRDLSAALKFYCNETMEDAHDAENDVLATIKILRGQMERYEGLDFIKESRTGNAVDMAGKIVLLDGVAVYNFGKDKGKDVKKNPGFGQWMLGQDFPINTKNVVKALIK